MTIAQKSAITLGFVGAFILGVWIGPYYVPPNPSENVTVSPADAAGTPAETATPAVAIRRTNAEPILPVVPASSEALQQRLKPVLNEGTNLKSAAEGFQNGEQFATVAHAADNLGVPFVVLKDRVLNERVSLVAAIRELKPGVDAERAAGLARIMARADIAAVAL